MRLSMRVADLSLLSANNVPFDLVFDAFENGVIVGVGTAYRLFDDAVNQLVLQHVNRGELQDVGSILFVIPVAPQDRRAAFG